MNAFKTASVSLILSLFTCSLCHADAMALSGRISEVKAEKDVISLVFTGHISFPIHGKTDQKLEIKVENVSIVVRELEKSERIALEKDGKRDLTLTEVLSALEGRIRAGGTAILVIVEPVVHFSEACTIEKIETKRIGIS